MVIAGFGEDEIYPSLISVEVDGIVSNILRYLKADPIVIGEDIGASIIPFRAN